MVNAISQDADGAPPAAVQVPAVPNNALGGNATTNAGATNQQEQQQHVIADQSTFYTGNPPAPTGEVAQFINRTVSTVGLKDQAAEACFTFLDDPASDLRDLN